jgi:hypothetical protein
MLSIALDAQLARTCSTFDARLYAILSDSISCCNCRYCVVCPPSIGVPAVRALPPIAFPMIVPKPGKNMFAVPPRIELKMLRALLGPVLGEDVMSRMLLRLEVAFDVLLFVII